MIFVRTGPRFLFLASDQTRQLNKLLLEQFDGIEVDFNEAIGIAGENDTIVMINDRDVDKLRVTKARHTVLIPMGSSLILAKLINIKTTDLINKAELGAGLLVQRLPKNGTKVIDMIKEDYQAQAFEIKDAINTGRADDTAIIFTDASLLKAVQNERMVQPCLLINQPITKMYRKLRREAVRYFTHGLEKSEWYEVRINIYDADENYEIHARRLELVLEDLEAGLILGETWTKDHALALFSVVAYQIRLFTIIDPLELKIMLLGMEYDHKGERFVDIDLYHRRSKIEWASIAKRTPFGRRKSGEYYREQLYAKLSAKTREKIIELERNLDRSGY
ncbi:hypothetical protein [Desulfofalx alkaliphila]|uniref:hypothetical protein n=1 Tax=Desulfofalx alkaliphila TaxID=105483 RepID=UPI00068A403D|nr:hypothetical protein [Desulfofalx alkaliphila]